VCARGAPRAAQAVAASTRAEHGVVWLPENVRFCVQVSPRCFVWQCYEAAEKDVFVASEKYVFVASTQSKLRKDFLAVEQQK
jgi:hypothetical protein